MCNDGRDWFMRGAICMVLGAAVGFMLSMIAYGIGYTAGRPDYVRTDADKKLQEIHRYIQRE